MEKIFKEKKWKRKFVFSNRDIIILDNKTQFIMNVDPEYSLVFSVNKYINEIKNINNISENKSIEEIYKNDSSTKNILFLNRLLNKYKNNDKKIAITFKSYYGFVDFDSSIKIFSCTEQLETNIYIRINVREINSTYDINNLKIKFKKNILDSINSKKNKILNFLKNFNKEEIVSKLENLEKQYYKNKKSYDVSQMYFVRYNTGRKQFMNQSSKLDESLLKFDDFNESLINFIDLIFNK